MTARKNVYISCAQIHIYGWKITIVEMVLAHRISAQVQIQDISQINIIYFYETVDFKSLFKEK